MSTPGRSLLSLNKQPLKASVRKPKGKARGPQRHAPFLKKRFQAVMVALVSMLPNGGHVSSLELARAMLEIRPGKEGGPSTDWAPLRGDKIGQRQAIRKFQRESRRYLAGAHRPNAGTAIRMGNALAICGVLWCTGWWMLYASGHLEEFILVTVAFVEDVLATSPERGIIEIWDMIVAAHELCLNINGSENAAMAVLHRRCASKTIEEDYRVYESLNPVEDATEGGWLDFVCRQDAKRVFRHVARYSASLQRAYKVYKDVNQADLDISAAVAIARSSRLTFDQKAFTIRMFLSRWFESKLLPVHRNYVKVLPLRSVERSPKPPHIDGIDFPNGLFPKQEVNVDDPRVHESLARLSGLSDLWDRLRESFPDPEDES